MVFDDQRGTLMVAGGVMTQYACDEPPITWMLSAGAWVSTPGQPRGQMVYDSFRHRVLTLGDQTYAWDGQAWKVVGGAAPIGAAAFDAKRGQVVVYLSTPGGPQTWLFGEATWALAQPTHQPSGRDYSVAAWDSRTSNVVLWGGALDGQASQSRLRETWTWDGIDWQNRSADASPPSSESNAMADGPTGVTLYTLASGTSQLWSFDGSRWTRLADPTPRPRFAPSIAYDSVHRLVYMFGGDLGDGAGGKTNETWTFDGSVWQQVGP
jgi:hypothetical protein